MSDLTVLLHDAEAWLSKVVGNTPASSALNDASQAVGAAASALETALPAVATAAANAALALIPGGLGSDFDSIADGLIDDVVALLVAKKSTAAPAPAAVAGTVV